MPIYEYECLDCLEVFEEINPISFEGPVLCKCGGEARKLISAPTPPRFGKLTMDAGRYKPSEAGLNVPEMYNFNFGSAERKRLNKLAQLDNM